MRTDARPVVRGEHLRAAFGARCPGFTLIEVLVVVSLLAVIASVVLSVGSWRLGRASLDESVPQIESAIVSARARALREGVVVLVLAESNTGEAWRIVEEVQSADPEDAAPDRAVMVELPRGVRFEPAPDPDVEPSPRRDETIRAAPTGASYPLALCLPDGRVEPALPLPVLAREERTLALVIQRWSGAVTSTPIAASTDGEAGGRRNDDPEQESPPGLPETTTP